MKEIKITVLSIVILTTIIVVSGFTSRYTKQTPGCEKEKVDNIKGNQQKQTINMFVTHGHCSLPFAGVVENLKVDLTRRDDGGNPLENMKISFKIDPNSFNACRGEDLTSRVKTPGLFISDNNEKITFRTTNVYTMGLDWYQVNGIMSIKGVEQEVKFFATGIRNPNEAKPSSIVLQGQLDLMDWGIDYDKIVNGKSDPVPTKWMYLNMRFDIC